MKTTDNLKSSLVKKITIKGNKAVSKEMGLRIFFRHITPTIAFVEIDFTRRVEECGTSGGDGHVELYFSKEGEQNVDNWFSVDFELCQKPPKKLPKGKLYWDDTVMDIGGISKKTWRGIIGKTKSIYSNRKPFYFKKA